MIFGLTHVNSGAMTYFMYNWPEEVWLTLIPIIPVENLRRLMGWSSVRVLRRPPRDQHCQAGPRHLLSLDSCRSEADR